MNLSLVSSEDLARMADFDVVKHKAWKAMNPSTATEVSIRSDILRDFEDESERALREKIEKEHKAKEEKKRYPTDLLERDDY